MRTLKGKFDPMDVDPIDLCRNLAQSPIGVQKASVDKPGLVVVTVHEGREGEVTRIMEALGVTDIRQLDLQ